MMMRLLWSPRALAPVAARASFGFALAIGTATLTIQVALLFSTAFAAGCEPYLSLADYGWTVVKITPIPALFLVAPACLLLLAVALLAGIGLLHRNHRRARMRVVFLSPLLLSIPMLLWTTAAALECAQDPSFGLIRGKPNWMMHPLIPLIASPWWMLPVLAALLLIILSYIRRLPQLLAECAIPMCSACGYNLTGNESGICSECGTKIGAVNVPGRDGRE